MEAIEKAKIAEFADRLNTQAQATNKQVADLQTNLIRMQGATAALDYVLNLDTVTLNDEDEVTETDISDLESYLSANPLEGNTEYEIVIEPGSMAAAEAAIESAP